MYRIYCSTHPLDYQIELTMNWMNEGLLGRELTSQGYVNIDGLDKSLGMLGQVSHRADLSLFFIPNTRIQMVADDSSNRLRKALLNAKQSQLRLLHTRILINTYPGEEAGDLQELHPRCRGRSRHHPRHRRGLRRHCLQQWICSW